MFGAGYLLEMLRHSENRPAEKKAATKKEITKESANLTIITSIPSISAEADELRADFSEQIEEPASSETTELPKTEETEQKLENVDFRINYDFGSTPRLLLKEIAAFSSKDVRYLNNFLKGCKWSPDGSCLLTNSEDRKLRVFTLPAAFYEAKFFDSPFLDDQTNDGSLNLLSQTNGGDLVYDYCWYPLMNSSTRESCVYVTSSRDHPIHLRDAVSGQLCASYLPINHLDEVTCAYSTAFSPDGSKLYAGFNKCIRIFDTYGSGRQISTKRTWCKGQGGQSGIISCIAGSPTTPNLFACGSYSRSVALYSESFEEGPLSTMRAEKMGGVTHLLFHPNGIQLYSGGRMDSKIICWDTRALGRIYASYERDAATNQRFYFDLDQSGRFLFTGGSTGEVKIWDTTKVAEGVQPVVTFGAHLAATNGIAVNPHLPILATSGGQRIFTTPLQDSLDNDSDADNDSALSEVYELDNSVKLWKIGRMSSQVTDQSID